MPGKSIIKKMRIGHEFRGFDKNREEWRKKRRRVWRNVSKSVSREFPGRQCVSFAKLKSRMK